MRGKNILRQKKEKAKSEEPHLHLEGHQPRIYRSRRYYARKTLKWSSLIILLLVVIALPLGLVWLKAKESEMRLPEAEAALDARAKGKPVNTLVLGVDRGSPRGDAGPGRSDIVMIIGLSGDGKRSAVVSIPRDSMVSLPGRSGRYKINAAHSYGGAALAIKTVREFTGLKIHHFLVIDFEGFKQIVDAVGGVSMYIEKEINDRYAGHVPAGNQVLDGETALALVRARHDAKAVPSGDLDRVRNQREFLKAMLKTVSKQRNPFRIVKLINAVAANIKTDLSFLDMFSLGRALNREETEMVTVPGSPMVRGGVWYFSVDEKGLAAILKPFMEGGSSHDRGAAVVERSGVRVMVLNGTRREGLGSWVASRLRQKGYNVLGAGNARTSHERTTLYHAGDTGYMAEQVLKDLGERSGYLTDRLDSLVKGYGADVVVVLGADF